MMKQSKDPFEVAYEEGQDESPPDSPIAAATAATADEFDTQNPAGTDADAADDSEDYDFGATTVVDPSKPSTSNAHHRYMNDNNAAVVIAKDKEEDYDDEEEDNMEVEELGKFSSTGDPDKMAKMQAILSQFTEQQMSRYESFRRSALQRSNMKRLLGSITGSQRISIPITIVVCGIAKMFVGELVETARMVMAERKDSGPIRPCHIREAFRRLKLEGRVLKRSVPRLFR